MDYSRIMRQPLAIGPKDATGCFDLLRAEAIKPIQESKGLPPSIGSCRIQVLHNMERHVKTAGKISEGFFKYTPQNTIGGVGQGAGCGPQDGNDQLGTLNNILEECTTAGFTFRHPSGRPEDTTVRHGPSFIDDQIDLVSLPTQGAQTSILVCQEKLQLWQNLLNVSGGDLQLRKCSFGILQSSFAFTKNGDTATLIHTSANPGDVYLQPYNQQFQPTKLKQLDHHTPEKYLGVFINLRGTWEREFSERLEKHTALAATISRETGRLIQSS